MMVARDASTFREMYATLALGILMKDPFDRGEVHAQKTTTPEMVTKELCDVPLQFDLYQQNLSGWQQMVGPNLPWAEDHFQERISGEPLNPPPSEAYWPYAQQGNSAHKSGERFSHTYPERFWPRFANEGGTMEDSQRVSAVPHVGLRFEYGDVNDLINILRTNPRSRQAYLPVWFPEDLNAAALAQRVPCTLGYHFLLQADDYLHMSYYMRSCDLVRFFKDDVYMAGRLLQWVAHEVNLRPGSLKLYIANLHAFEGDKLFLETTAYQEPAKVEDPRANYNFGALG
jgi:hypothetical protein